MTVTVHVPPLLRNWFHGQAEVEAKGHTISECLGNLIDIYPELEIRLKTVAVCLNGELVQVIHYGNREIKDGDEITFLPRMSGG